MDKEIRTTIRMRLSKKSLEQWNNAKTKSEFVRRCIESACQSSNVDKDATDMEFYIQELHLKVDDLHYKLEQLTNMVAEGKIVSVASEEKVRTKEDVDDLGEHAATLQAFMNFGNGGDD